MTRPLAQRLAGAPISWGVCEVPGWGPQLPPPLVLQEMAALGLCATEFGPDGFLPPAGVARRQVLAQFGLRAVGGFVPVVAHDPDRDPLSEVGTLFDDFVAAGGDTVVFAAVDGRDGYDSRTELDAKGWQTLCRNLDRLAAAAVLRGLRPALHPHVGTLVERDTDLDIVLDGCGIALCLDTGHLMVGGVDPLAVARLAAQRVAHVHLKDVDAAIAARVRSGVLSYTDAVKVGMYRPLGRGGAHVAEVVSALEAAGYDGWYVLEQDRVLVPDRNGVAHTTAAIRADVEESLAHIMGAAQAQLGAA
jgi:inosose dehydratase